MRVVASRQDCVLRRAECTSGRTALPKLYLHSSLKLLKRRSLQTPIDAYLADDAFEAPAAPPWTYQTAPCSRDF